MRVFDVRFVVRGDAEGEVLKSDETICFWGGIHPGTGVVLERDHQLSGQSVSGKILAYPRGRGSSSTSAVLLEAVRRGGAPLAIVNVDSEPIIAIGCAVAGVLYGRALPVAVVSEEAFQALETGRMVRIDGEKGTLTIMD